MAVRCSYCGRAYDVTLFEFDRSITCVCGETITFKHEELTAGAVLVRKAEDRKVREITAKADRIASMIADSAYHMTDIVTEKQKLREKISELFPDKTELYDLIYEPRFRRLTEQFRGETN